MSSTNKTPNYNLSQFTADDKPAWLGDYNSDMQKIDAQMKANATKADSAESTANNANQTASDALEASTEAKTLASGASTNASTALSTAQSANETAQSASQNAQTAKDTANTASGLASSANSNAQNANTNATKALNELNKFNLNNFKTYTESNMIPLNGLSELSGAINIAYDNTKTVFKLYGIINLNTQANQNGQIKIQNTPFRPSKKITIQNAGIGNCGDTTTFVNIEIDTNGDLYLDYWTPVAGTAQIGLFNCLYFLQEFDQTIIDPS